MNLEKLRKDFPILDKDIIYFDNACMTLKPVQVIDALNRYYREFPGCAGRSPHRIGKQVDEEVTKSRTTLRKSFNAKKDEEIIFTKNTTEGLNIVASSLDLKPGDVVLSTDKEHNSNLLPLQRLRQKGVIHKVIDSTEDNQFSMKNFEDQMSKKIKFVSMVHTSNLDGTTIPAKEIIKIAHDNGALVMLDGAQSAPHKSIDLKKLDVDFFACSGHKMCGPTGIGMLYGKYDLMDNLPPYIVGGETVYDSTYTTADFEHPPHKFEPGLQHYAGIIGFAEASRYLDKIGKDNIVKHEQVLNQKLSEGLLALSPKFTILGPKNPVLRSGIVNFTYGDADPHQIAIMLDASAKICIRSGAHCVHSWFNKHHLKGSARASMYFYNTENEVDVFLEQIKKVVSIL